MPVRPVYVGRRRTRLWPGRYPCLSAAGEPGCGLAAAPVLVGRSPAPAFALAAFRESRAPAEAESRAMNVPSISVVDDGWHIHSSRSGFSRAGRLDNEPARDYIGRPGAAEPRRDCFGLNGSW